MAENIFLFVPNLIGYGRILLAFISFYYMTSDHVTAATCYLLSVFLDELDGHAARMLNQCSKFGTMLDMLTDRCSTACWLIRLGTFYPQYVFIFQGYVAIDIACHWLHLHTSLMEGRTSHKSSDANPNVLLQVYYTSRAVLFVMCFGNELFYAALYLLNFTEGPTILLGIGLWRIVAYLMFPIAVFKVILALMQGYYAAITLTNIDLEERAKGKYLVN